VANTLGSSQRTISTRTSILSPKHLQGHVKNSHRFAPSKERPSPLVAPPQTPSLGWQALEDMFRSSRSKFVRIAYRILQNREDAEDAVQNALVSAYVHLPVFEGRSALTTWFTRIVLNAALMIVRKRKAAHANFHAESAGDFDTNWSDIIPSGLPDPETTYAQTEKLELVDNLLHQVSPALRQAFTMAYRDGFAAREVGDLLSLPTGTVKARLFRAKQIVKRRALRSLSRGRAIPSQPIRAFSHNFAQEFAGA
jgi:RNA polymerase sigma-70 factor, ECF subfamily